MGIYDHFVRNANGEEVPLSKYKGKILLIVNTATKCGFTVQYEELQSLYEKFHDKGLEIIDIPCNQFNEQSPGTHEEIKNFCKKNYGTGFEQMGKSDVNGENELPLYTYLKSQKGFEGFGVSLKALAMDAYMKVSKKNYKNCNDIKWNFTKFLVDRQGNVVERFEPTGDMEKVKIAIEDLL